MTVRLLPEYVALLGEIPDRALAKIAGCVPQTIAKIRSVAGIPTWRGSGKAQAADRTRTDRLYAGRLVDFEHLLGTTTDTEIATLAGCSRELVRQRRVKLRIAKFEPAVVVTEPRAPVPRQRPQLDHAMTVAESLDQPFTLADLATALGRSLHLFQPTFARWLAEGAFERSGSETSGKYKVGTKPVFYPDRRQIDGSYDHLLGTMSDYALASHLRAVGKPVAYTQILRRRTKLKIDAFKKKR